MDDPDDRPYAREPQLEDVTRICAALNRAGARYLLIGGFAVVAHGYVRTTKDIDLLIDSSPENVGRVRSALSILEDQAVADVADDDVAKYSVVRIADEVVVDLMARACGIDYDEAVSDAETVTIDEVKIPLASPATLIRTKQTARPADAADRAYLAALLDSRRGG